MALQGRAAAVVLLASASLLAPAPAPVAAAPPEPTWDVSATTGYSGGRNYLLNAVHVPEPGDVWAVGYKHGSVGGAYEFRTVVMRGTEGGTFDVVPSPDREGAPATNFLQDVHGVSSTDLWAVGQSRNPGQRYRTLIEHWNGTEWSIWPSADPGPLGNVLNGVVAVRSDDVWAVGARQDTFYQSPLVEHWDGSTWTAVKAPNPAFCTNHSYLTDVAARSASFVVATGICTSTVTGGDQGYVLQWNGSRWFESKATKHLPAGATLSSVSIYNNAVWLAGSMRAGGGFAMRNQDAGWVSVPIAGTDRTFAGVVARRNGVAWAVGTGPSPQPPFAGPGAMSLDGKGGVGQPIPISFGSLRGVAYDKAGRVWAVGTQLPGQYNTPLVVSRPAP